MVHGNRCIMIRIISSDRADLYQYTVLLFSVSSKIIEQNEVVSTALMLLSEYMSC